MLNELFYDFLKKLEALQIDSFELMNQMGMNGFIQVPLQISQYNNSTYFKHQYALNPNVEMKEINNFLAKLDFNYWAEPYVPKFAPMDKVFKKQFKNNFSNSAFGKDMNHLKFLHLRKIKEGK